MEVQIDLIGNQRQKWSCCHCSWIGLNPIIENDNSFGYTTVFHLCPKCGWVCWLEDKAKEMTGLYYMFRKKYGEVEDGIEERDDETLDKRY